MSITAAAIAQFVPSILKAIDSLHLSGEEKLKAMLDMAKMQRDIIVAEASSEHVLTSTWRPILMLSIVAILVNNYILAPYFSALFGWSVALTLPPQLWDLLKIGVGGYVVGRSAEKITRHLKGRRHEADPDAA